MPSARAVASGRVGRLFVLTAMVGLAGCTRAVLVEAAPEASCPSLGDGGDTRDRTVVTHHWHYSGPTFTDVLEGLAVTMKLIAQVATVLFLVDRLADS